MTQKPDVVRRGIRTKGWIGKLTNQLDRHPTLVLLAVMAVVIVVRLLYLSGLRENPFFSDLILDSRLYDWWGLRIASGDWVGRDVFFMAPLYPYFVGVIYLLLGHSPFATVSIQLLLGSVSCVLVFSIAKRIVGILVAMTSALMLAFYGPLLFFEGLLLPEVLGILINLTWLYLLVRRGTDASPKTFLLAGVLLGLAALTRASALLFIPCIVLWLCLVGRPSYRRVLILGGTLVAGVCLVISPVTIRNYVVGEDVVLITSNGGLNLYIGNNENADGVYRMVEGLHMVGADPESDWTGKHYAEQALGRELKPSEVSGYWLGESLRFIRGHPGKFTSLILRKIALFWNSYEIPQIEDYYVWKDSSPFPVPLLPFAFLGPLGVVGMILTIRRRNSALLLSLFVLFYMVSICIFFVTARYRVQVVPVLSIFSGCALWWLVDRMGRRLFAQVAVMVCSVVILWAAMGSPVLTALGMKPEADSWRWHLDKGTRLLSNASSLDEAIRELKLADKMKPGDAEILNNLGSAYEKKRLPVRATAAFKQAVRADSTYVEAWYNLALLRQRLEEYQMATAIYLRVLELQPYLPRAHFNLAICYFRQGMLAESVEHLRIVVDSEPQNAEAHNQLGIVLGEQGDLDGAVLHFRAALRAKPSYAAAQENLEMILRWKSEH